MSYCTMFYGGVLGAALSLVLVALAGRERRWPVLVGSALAALAMPLFWNCILRQTEATSSFSHDLPFRPFPISWQDTGSAVFTLAGAAVVLALGPQRKDPAIRVIAVAALTAFAALVIDVYAY